MCVSCSISSNRRLSQACALIADPETWISEWMGINRSTVLTIRGTEANSTGQGTQQSEAVASLLSSSISDQSVIGEEGTSGIQVPGLTAGSQTKVLWFVNFDSFHDANLSPLTH